MSDWSKHHPRRRWMGTVASILLAAVVLGWLAVQTGFVRQSDGDSFGATLSLGSSGNTTDVVGVEQRYDLKEKDQSFWYQAISPASRQVSFAWKAPQGTGVVEAVVTQNGTAVANLALVKAGCRKVTLPEAGPMQIELRVHAPAQGSVELGWDDEQLCG